MMHRLFAFHLTAALIAALPLVGCVSIQVAVEEDTGEAAAISFSEDIQPLIEAKFAPLLTEDEGLRVDTWQHLIEGSEHGAVFIAYDAENSLLVEVAEHAAAEDRPGAPTPEEIALVREWIEAGARNDASEAPYANATALAYVANQNAASVSVIDMEHNLVIRTVDLTEYGFSENAKPHDVVVEPGGAHWYVSLIGENVVLKFNRDNEIVGRAEFEVPGMLTLDPTSDRLFVGRSMSAVNPPNSIGIVNREDMTAEIVDVFYPRPHALAVKPDGSPVYSASLAENRIGVVNSRTQEVELMSLDGPVHTLVQFDVAPDGQTMVAGVQLSGVVFFFDIGSGPVPTVTDTLTVGGQPWHPSYTPDGRYIYLPRKTANAVTVIDAEDHTVEAVIEGRGLAGPHGSAVRPDGRYVYVSSNNTAINTHMEHTGMEGEAMAGYTPRYDLPGNENTGTVVVIDTQTNEIVRVLDVGENAAGVGAPPAS